MIYYSYMAGTLLGIDIGHDSIKLAGLTTGSKPQLVGCKSIHIDAILLGRGQLTDTGPVTKALKQALAEAAPKPLKPGPAILALSESLLSRKVLELPASISQEELRDAITVQSAEYLPLPIDEMELDFQVLGVQEDGLIQQVMVVAASSKLIGFYVKAIQDAGILLEAIDTKPSALGRFLVPAKDKEAYVMLDIGSELSTVSIYHHGMVQVASTVNLGGNIIKDPTTGKPDTEREAALIERLVSEVAGEVEHVVKFYINRSLDDEPVKQVLVTGGGSLMAGVTEQLAKALSMPMKPAKPPMTLPPFCDASYNGALGAARYSYHG